MVVEQRPLVDQEGGGGDDPGAERERLEAAAENDDGDEADRDEDSGRRVPVQRVQEHAVCVVGEAGAADALRAAVLDDDALPEVAERVGVAKEERADHDRRAGQQRERLPRRAAREHEHGERSYHRRGQQLHRERGAGERARRKRRPRPPARRRQHDDRGEREDGRDRVGLDLRRLRRVGMRHREERSRADPARLAGDRAPGQVREREPDERDYEEAGADTFDTVAEDRADRLEEDVEARRLGDVDVRSECLPVPEGVERCEVDALVEVGARVQAADVQGRRDGTDRSEGEDRRARRGAPHEAARTARLSTNTSPPEGSSIQFAAMPTR